MIAVCVEMASLSRRIPSIARFNVSKVHFSRQTAALTARSYPVLSIPFRAFSSPSSSSPSEPKESPLQQQQQPIDQRQDTSNNDNKDSKTNTNNTNDPELERLLRRHRIENFLVATGFSILFYKFYKFLTDFPEACTEVMESASRDPFFVEKVGVPVKCSMKWTGTVNEDFAVVNLPLTGPKGKALVKAQALYSPKMKRWQVVDLQAVFPESPQHFSLDPLIYESSLLYKGLMQRYHTMKESGELPDDLEAEMVKMMKEHEAKIKASKTEGDDLHTPAHHKPVHVPISLSSSSSSSASAPPFDAASLVSHAHGNINWTHHRHHDSPTDTNSGDVVVNGPVKPQ